MTTTRLLILVQAVDLDDSLMGFFHEWLVEAATQFSEITVLALRVGRYQLPANVHVIPMRSRASRSRVRAGWTILRQAWKLRHVYDAVFIRGDVQYVLLAGWLWRLLGKRMVLWYAHYKTNRMVWPASLIADVVATSVPEACAHPRVHPVSVGQALPHEQFQQRPVSEYTSALRMLTLGRVVPIKGIRECVEAFLKSDVEDRATLEMIGPRPDVAYERAISSRIADHPSVSFGPALIPYDQLPTRLRSFDVLLNAYPASLDKVIIESMMSGVIPVVTTEGLRHCLPAELHWLIACDEVSRVAAIKRIAALSPQDRFALAHRLRDLAIEHHSLHGQVGRIKALCFPSLS